MTSRPNPPPRPGTRPERRRMLVVVNPCASKVTIGLRNLVISALRGGYEVEAVETEAGSHATEIARAAAEGGLDIAVAFGGDGTANEVATGLLGSRTSLAVLPGGANNVICRTLGFPNDVARATEHLLAMAAAPRLRPIDVASVNDRHFLCASGIGFDAEGLARAAEHPRLKATLGNFWYGLALLSAFGSNCRGDPPALRVQADGGTPVDAAATIVQNSDPVAFVGRRPLRVSDSVDLASGTLSLAALRRLRYRDAPGLSWRMLSKPAVTAHRQIVHVAGSRRILVTTASRDSAGDPVPFALHVDGDPIGHVVAAEYRIRPRALSVVASDRPPIPLA